MIKIKTIGFGRENLKNKREIMKENGITKENDFNEQLADLKKKYVILTYYDGYYRPCNAREYNIFIDKLKKTRKTLDDKIELALKELKQRGL